MCEWAGRQPAREEREVARRTVVYRHCDVCGVDPEPTPEFKITHGTERVTLDLCADHAAPVLALMERRERPVSDLEARMVDADEAERIRSAAAGQSS